MLKSFLTILIISLTTMVSAETFEIQRLSKFRVSEDIKKVFIHPKLINSENDKVGFKDHIIQQLQAKLSSLGRYEVILGEPKGFDPNNEVVAVIQGDVISGGEIVKGQFTEWAICKGGLSGLVGAGVAASTSKQGITMSGRNFLCKLPNFQAMAAEAAMELLTGPAPTDEVARIYKYKNYSIFVQVNLSITQLGKVRKTLLTRTDSASFSRHYPEASSYRNVRESSQGDRLLLTAFGAIPIIPMPKELALVRGSNPASAIGNYYDLVVPEAKNIPAKELAQIREKMVAKVLKNFTRSIAPYKVRIEANIDEAGSSQSVELMKERKFVEAKKSLNGLSDKNASDLYNLGLTFEATASTVNDFKEALILYNQAYDSTPIDQFASAIGRVEREIRSYNLSIRK